MAYLLALPYDIQFELWSTLDLTDILRLRQTCSELSSAISRDKQLWAYIFERDVKMRSLCYPQNFRDIERLDAPDIESCVKHAVTLSRTYTTIPDRKLSVRRLGSRRGLSVTWLKLIRGHWCLVASASDTESELALWRIPAEGEIRVAARVYLEAPVIDGMIDDSKKGVRCAITVGTSRPYILILAVYQSSSGGADISQLKEISDVSHVRFLRGSFVGFAVRDGDDTYPFLMNWETGHLHRVCLPCVSWLSPFSPLPMEACSAMTIREHYVFTLHRSAIHVFAMPEASDASRTSDLKHISTLPFQAPICSGRFVDGPENGSHKQRNIILYVCFQDMLSRLREATVTYDRRADIDASFSLSETLNKNLPDVPGPRYLHRYQLGTSGKVMLCITSLENRRWATPRVSFSSMNMPLEADSDTMLGTHAVVSKKDMPLLHLLSCVDFDDGNGLLLLGTLSGRVRLASILSKTILTSGSLRCDLNDPSNVSTCTPKKIFMNATSMDMPIFYGIRASHEWWDNIPMGHIEQVQRLWSEQNNNLVPFSHWSNDWSAFEYEYIFDWLIPLSRLGPLDADFMETAPSITVRNRIQSVGEIVPVLYDTQNHCRVVFRIGERLYYSRTRRDVEDEQGNLQFANQIGDILGILPVTYTQLLTQPASIEPALAEFSTQTNLTGWFCPAGLRMQMLVADAVYTIRDYWDRSDGGENPLEDEVMEGWNDDEWDRQFQSATRPD